MMTYDESNYALMWEDKDTRQEIRRAKRQAAHRAGPAGPLQVKVISIMDESAEPLRAKAALSADGTYLNATFTMPDFRSSLTAEDSSGSQSN